MEWTPESGATGYQVYVKPAGAADAQYRQLDNELIRRYPSYWRADAVGLAAGSYVLKVEALLSGGGRTSVVTGALPVAAHDRSGFALPRARPMAPDRAPTTRTARPGRSEGAVCHLCDGADGRARCRHEQLRSGAEGHRHRPDHGAEAKGYDKTPLAVRIVGQITEGDMSGQLNGSGYLQVKGKPTTPS